MYLFTQTSTRVLDNKRIQIELYLLTRAMERRMGCGDIMKTWLSWFDMIDTLCI